MGARAESAQDHGGASAYRSDGKVDRESRSDENERRATLERTEVTVMTKPSALDIPHSPAAREPGEGGSLGGDLIATAAQLTGVIPQIEAAERVAVDTEADSLHSYREKLCLLQISVPAVAGIVDAGDEQRDLCLL